MNKMVQLNSPQKLQEELEQSHHELRKWIKNNNFISDHNRFYEILYYASIGYLYKKEKFVDWVIFLGKIKENDSEEFNELINLYNHFSFREEVKKYFALSAAIRATHLKIKKDAKIPDGCFANIGPGIMRADYFLLSYALQNKDFHLDLIDYEPFFLDIQQQTVNLLGIEDKVKCIDSRIEDLNNEKQYHGIYAVKSLHELTDFEEYAPQIEMGRKTLNEDEKKKLIDQYYEGLTTMANHLKPKGFIDISDHMYIGGIEEIVKPFLKKLQSKTNLMLNSFSVTPRDTHLKYHLILIKEQEKKKIPAYAGQN